MLRLIKSLRDNSSALIFSEKLRLLRACKISLLSIPLVDDKELASFFLRWEKEDLIIENKKDSFLIEFLYLLCLTSFNTALSTLGAGVKEFLDSNGYSYSGKSVSVFHSNIPVRF